MAEHPHLTIMRALPAFLPTGVAVLFVMLVNLPVSVTGGLMPAPLLAFIPIYFWSLLRPDLMPPGVALCVGLLEDLLSGGPPGLWAAGFLAGYAFTDQQSDSLGGLSGIGAVLGFASAVFLSSFVAYFLAALVFWRFSPIAPLLLECAVTVVLYPIVAPILGWLHRPLIGPLRNEV